MAVVINPEIEIEPLPVPPLHPPTVLDLIASAVVAYPATDVELELVDLDTDGPDVNVGEQVSFRVKVTNRGPLTMKDVRLKAVAKNGAEVKSGGAAEQFGPEAVSANLIESIDGHGGSEDSSALFIIEAPNRSKPDDTVLVEVTVDSWIASFDHTLVSHSRASDTPMVTFASTVLGD
jgi:Domain of unknown function DUF11